MPIFSTKSSRSLRQEFEPGKEGWKTNEYIEEHIRNIGEKDFDYIGPGGSAFNTTRVLAQLNAGFHLGYVGVVGEPTDQCDLNKCISEYSIDSTYVFHSNKPPGKCISLYWKSEQDRALMTGPGANDELVDKLSDPKIQVELPEYLAESKWIHLTSFVNRKCLSLVIGILKRAKSKNRSLTISFDPGSEYCRNPSSEVKEAIKISDYLFLTGKEFYQLAGYQEVLELKRAKIDEKKIASRIYKLCQCQTLIVVVKSYNSTRFFQSFKDSTLTRRFWHVPLLPPSIVDDTGAGDVFAAGFIAGHLIPVLGFDMKTAILFSSRLVKTKLRTVGCDAEMGYQHILNQTLREIRLKENLNLTDSRKTLFSELKGILIGIAIALIGSFLFYWLWPH